MVHRERCFLRPGSIPLVSRVLRRDVLYRRVLEIEIDKTYVRLFSCDLVQVSDRLPSLSPRPRLVKLEVEPVYGSEDIQ